jgi:DNA-binding CsgD family transcriptional regulator
MLGVRLTPREKIFYGPMMKHRFDSTRLRRPRTVGDRLRELATETLCHTLPTGVLALDGNGALLFANREGIELIGRWLMDGRQAFARKPETIPPEFIDACFRLRHPPRTNTERRQRPKFGGRILVRHPKNPSLSAVVALERSTRDRRVPIFCILLHDRFRESLSAGRQEQMALMTTAERKVARLVAEGLRNTDIAAALGKSVVTVKTQLRTIFAKLNLGSRTQLAAVLRSA